MDKHTMGNENEEKNIRTKPYIILLRDKIYKYGPFGLMVLGLSLLLALSGSFSSKFPAN